MSQYLKIKYNSNQEAYVPTKNIIDNIQSQINEKLSQTTANTLYLPISNPESTGVFYHKGNGTGNNEVVWKVQSSNGTLTGYGDTASTFHFGGVSVTFDQPLIITTGMIFQAANQTLDMNGVKLTNVQQITNRGTHGLIETGCDFNDGTLTTKNHNFVVKNSNINKGVAAAGNGYSFQSFVPGSTSGEWDRVFGVKASGEVITNGISNYINTSSGTGTNYFDITAGYINDGGTLGYRNRSIRLITHQTMAGVTPYTNTLYVESYPAGPGIQVYPNDAVGTKNLGTSTSPWTAIYTTRVNSNTSALGFENGYGTYTFKKDSEGNVLISPSTVGKALDSIILDSGKCDASVYNWTRVTLRMHYHGGSSYDINFQGYGPDTTPQFAPDKSGSVKLGNLGNLWSEVYAKSGTIQTSDRSSKSNIHYIDEPKPKTRSVSQEEVFTTNDLVEFVKQLNPATFVYKNIDNEDQAVEEALEKSPASIQLGLIADDIKDTSLYKYIGVEEHFDKIIEKAEYDEEGNTIKEAVTEPTTALGLKPIPLATLALTACKYLINKLDIVEQQLAELEK